MADLEGFFAKKDKKKSKPKKFVPEEMAQKLEEAEKKQQEKERRAELSRSKMREQEQLENDNPAQKQEPVDEWQDEEEETVDLSDLNIKELPQPEADKPDDEHGHVDADGNPTNQPVGPWNKKAVAREPAPEEPEPEPVKRPEPAPAAPEPAKPSSGGYVPPHRRNMPAGSDSAAGGGGPLAPVRLGAGTRSRYTRAPDISSDQAFPTLGAAVEDTARGAWGQRGAARQGGEFQRVRHGNASSQDQRLHAPKLSIGNQFDALRSNDC